MPSYIVLTGLALLTAYAINTYRSFAANLAAAKQSGLPYIVTPVYLFNRFWLVTHPIWIFVLESIFPRQWLLPWIECVQFPMTLKCTT